MRPRLIAVLLVFCSTLGFSQDSPGDFFALSLQAGPQFHLYDAPTAAALGSVTLGPNADIRAYFGDFMMSFRAAVTTVTARKDLYIAQRLLASGTEINPIDFGFVLGYRYRHLLDGLAFEYLRFVEVEVFAGHFESTFTIPANQQKALADTYQFKTTSGLGIGFDMNFPILRHEQVKVEVSPQFCYTFSNLSIIEESLGKNSLLLIVNLKLDYYF